MSMSLQNNTNIAIAIQMVLENKIIKLRDFLSENSNFDFTKHIYEKVIRLNRIEIMQMLINEFNFQINFNNSSPIIICSHTKDNFDMMKLLIENGSEINITKFVSGSKVNIILYNCCLYSTLQTIKLLLEMNLDANTGGGILLQLCCRYRNYDVVKLLMLHGANERLDIALLEASRNGKSKIVQLLLENGADISIFSNIKSSKKKYIKTFNLLTEKGVDPANLLQVFLTK